MFSELDIDTWPRKAAYEFFKDYDDPFFNFTADVDISHLYSVCKTNSLTVSLAVLYCAVRSANAIREFKIREVVGGKLVEFDRVHATQTILNDDEETFSFCYFEAIESLVEFERAGKLAVSKYNELRSFDVESDRFDLIYFSVIPWVSFTSFKHASRNDPRQTIPRVVFGKFFDNGGSKRMPLSVEANHRVMDGLHVGRFFQRFQEIADSL